MKLRSYQVEAVANVYRIFGLHPAGPDDEPIVQRYRQLDANGSSDRRGENGNDGGPSGDVAAGASNDAVAPIRVEQAGSNDLRGFLSFF